MPEHAGWFFDSVTLSNFALADGLGLLAVRYRHRGFAVTQVADELTHGIAAGYARLTGCLDLLDRGILRIAALQRAERSIYRHLAARLGRGEAGTIAAACHRRGTVVTDDLAARRTCADMGMPLTGTVGILRAAVHDRQLTADAANGLLQKMIEAGFHAPVNRIV